MRPGICAVGLLLCTTLLGQPPPDLYRCPVGNVISMQSGAFRDTGLCDLLLVQDLGRLEIGRQPGRPALDLHLSRLALVGLVNERFDTIWTSPTLACSDSAGSEFNTAAWACGDIDRDGLVELLIMRGESCSVFSFDSNRVTEAAAAIPGASPIQAQCCDVDGDSWDELILLQSAAADSGSGRPCLQVFQPLPPVFRARSSLLPCFPADSAVRVSLIGRARLDDYEHEVAVIAGEHPDLRPGLYAALHLTAADTFRLTQNPFPWQPWFGKTRVLPAGPLLLTNVGDTLVGYGYFVPGSRPSGPAQSFAALQDGEWRLLGLTDAAARISGPLCRYTYRSINGWLELRGDIFRFYPGEPFRWR